MTINNAPPNRFLTSDVPLIHKMCEFYKNIYRFSANLPKRDRYGIYQKIENNCLVMIDQTINASFQPKSNKLNFLNDSRIKIEVLKRFIRITHDLKVMETKKYLEFELALEEISKMTNGWIKYLNK